MALWGSPTLARARAALLKIFERRATGSNSLGADQVTAHGNTADRNGPETGRQAEGHRFESCNAHHLFPLPSP